MQLRYLIHSLSHHLLFRRTLLAAKAVSRSAKRTKDVKSKPVHLLKKDSSPAQPHFSEPKFSFTVLATYHCGPVCVHCPSQNPQLLEEARQIRSSSFLRIEWTSAIERRDQFTIQRRYGHCDEWTMRRSPAFIPPNAHLRPSIPQLHAKKRQIQS